MAYGIHLIFLDGDIMNLTIFTEDITQGRLSNQLLSLRYISNHQTSAKFSEKYRLKKANFDSAVRNMHRRSICELLIGS